MDERMRVSRGAFLRSNCRIGDATRRTAGRRQLIWGVGLPVDEMTFPWARNIRMWDSGRRSRQTSLERRQWRCVSSQVREQNHPRDQFSRCHYFITIIVLHPPPTFVPPSLPFEPSLETVLREEVGVSLVCRSSEVSPSSNARPTSCNSNLHHLPVDLWRMDVIWRLRVWCSLTAGRVWSFLLFLL